MQHADVEIPQEKPAIVAHASKPICPLIATPRVKGHRGNPRVVSLTPCHDLPLRHRPDGKQIVLTAGHDVFAVRRPANA